MTEPEVHEVFVPDNGCFGCSLTRTDGLGMRFWHRGDVIFSELAIPEGFHGSSGFAHGGIVATLCDEISSAAAAWEIGWFVVTGELTVRYHRPIPIGAPLQWEARVTDRSHPRYFVVEAWVRRDGEELARSTSKVFRASPSS